MKINQKTCNDNRVIRTLIEQVSALQEDVTLLQNEDSRLDNSKLDKADIEKDVASPLDAKFNDLGVGGALVGNSAVFANVQAAEELKAKKAVITDLTVESITTATGSESASSINKLSSAEITVSDLYANRTDIGPGGLSVTGDTVLADTETGELKSTDITAESVTASQANAHVINVAGYDDEIGHKHYPGVINTDEIKAGKAEIDEIKVNTGKITVKNIEVETLNATDEKLINGLETGYIVANELQTVIPEQTYLEAGDTYTLELPTFTGTYYMVWKHGDDIKWSAVVTGNGTDYSISWNSIDKDNFAITELFQANNKAYIRTNSNGGLYYIYVATEKEANHPLIYKNLNGWNGKTLEELTDERTRHTCNTPNGYIVFGAYYAPSFVIADTPVYGDLELNKLKVNGSLEVVPETITWNGVSVKVCNDFNTDWVL